jgi:multimeric flavodoxin WrbA
LIIVLVGVLIPMIKEGIVKMSKILIAYQTFSGTTRSLAESAAEGARSVGADAEVKNVTSTNPEDLSDVDGLILATTQPFQSMAGDTKSMFERLWIGRDKIKKSISFAAIICHKNDPKSTEENIKTIVEYLGFKQDIDWLEVKDDDIEAGKERARQLGITIAQGG